MTFQLHHLGEGVLLTPLRPSDGGALLGPADLLQMQAPQVAAAITHVLFGRRLPLPATRRVGGQGVLSDCVILAGSPTRRPTGRR